MTLVLGWAPGRLQLNLNPAMDFTGRIELQDPPGVPAPWPAGTSAWLRLSVRGGSFEAIWPAVTNGSVLQWNTAAADVAEVPITAWAELWLDYPSPSPILWLEGPAAVGPCGTAGFGGTGYVVAVPGTGSGAVAVPVPGPTGPPGESSSAIIVTGVAYGPLSGHRAVIRRPDGALMYASSDNPEHLSLPIQITTGAAADGDVASAVAFGALSESSWAWTPGPIFLGLAGALTQVVPTAPGSYFLAQIGAATSPTSVFVDRGPSIQLI